MMKKLISFMYSVLVFGVLSSPVYAAPSDNPDFVANSVQFGNDVLKWILILVPVAAAASIGFSYLKQILNPEDNPAQAANAHKFMKKVLIYSVIAEIASGIVKLVLSYYQ